MVRSANLFCFRQKTLTNKQQSLGEDFLQRNNCCICYFVRGRPAPVHFIKLRGERRQQEDIFAHRQSSIWKDTFSGDENKFLAGTGGAWTHNLFNLVLLRLRRPLVSTAAAARSLPLVVQPAFFNDIALSRCRC